MLSGLSFLIYLGTNKNTILGQPVTDWDLQPLTGTDQTLTYDACRGKLVVLHFWGPWCPPCRVEYPEIARLQTRYANSDEVHIVSVTCDSTAPENRETLQSDTEEMLANLKVTQPVYWDPAEYTRVQVAKLLAQRGFSYPTTLLLDRQGRVVNYWLGATDAGEIDSAIAAALLQPRIGP